MAVHLVWKLKLSQEGRAGSQMVRSIRWPAVSHFPPSLVSLGADLFEAGLPLGQVAGPLFWDCLGLF